MDFREELDRVSPMISYKSIAQNELMVVKDKFNIEERYDKRLNGQEIPFADYMLYLLGSEYAQTSSIYKANIALNLLAYVDYRAYHKSSEVKPETYPCMHPTVLKMTDILISEANRL